VSIFKTPLIASSPLSEFGQVITSKQKLTLQTEPDTSKHHQTHTPHLRINYPQSKIASQVAYNTSSPRNFSLPPASTPTRVSLLPTTPLPTQRALFATPNSNSSLPLYHSPPPPHYNPWFEIENKHENRCINGISDRHLSLQKLVLKPSPIFLTTSELNQ